MSMLIPQWVQIYYYKSIIDSGKIWLSSDLTILAGKNESGKSAILNAIYDFSPDVDDIDDDAYPMDHPDAVPKISIHFSMPESVSSELFDNFPYPISSRVIKSINDNGITVSREADTGYTIPDSLWKKLEKQVNPIDMLDDEALRDAMINALSLMGNDLESFDIEKWKNADNKTLFKEADLLLTSFTKWFSTLADQNLKTKAGNVRKELQSVSKTPSTEIVPSTFVEHLLSYIPTITIFSDFENLLPFEVPLNEASEYAAVRDFAEIAGLDLDDLAETSNRQALRNKLETHSASISGKFKDYYEQDQVELKAEPDGELLRIGVKGQGDTILYRAEQRSQGMQWFLSFFLRLNAAGEDQQIVLIDEPGLYLHASAQSDILRVLEDLAASDGFCRVIFSTHSPYLLDTERMDRLRLVSKSKTNGTEVINKIHRGADKETLTPVITALGIDVARSGALVSEKNIITEGISDYYYLSAFYSLSSKNAEASILPAVGASKTHHLASIAIGWGLQFCILLDNDDAGNQARTKLKQLDIGDNQIVFVSDENGTIEDIFTPSDFHDFVLGGDGKASTKPPSQQVKDKKLDKVLLSRKFAELCHTKPDEITLSEQTTKNIETLLDSLAKSVKAHSSV